MCIVSGRHRHSFDVRYWQHFYSMEVLSTGGIGAYLDNLFVSHKHIVPCLCVDIESSSLPVSKVIIFMLVWSISSCKGHLNTFIVSRWHNRNSHSVRLRHSLFEKKTFIGMG